MGTYEDFYKAKLVAQEKSANDGQVGKHNLQTNFVRKRIKEILRNLKKRLPETCDWVTLDGKERVCWDLWKDVDWRYRIALLPPGDGGLVYIYNTSTIYRISLKNVTSVDDFANVPREREFLRGEALDGTFRQLVQADPRFGIECRTDYLKYLT